MSARNIARRVGAVLVTVWSVLLSAPTTIAPASAAPCPDIDVTFARGTGEPSGIGVVGQEFTHSLRTQVGARSIAVYAVDYPASDDFVPSANDGTHDANAHPHSGRPVQVATFVASHL